MGGTFGWQKSLPAEYWLILYNDLITVVPLFCPVWSFGRTFRVKSMTWAKPVYDRFDLKDVIDILNLEPVIGRFTGTTFCASHQYFSPAWNRHGDKHAITLEIRLNEQHPYFLLPSLELLNRINHGTFSRLKSVKMVNQVEVSRRIWSACVGKDIYKGLLSVKDVRFHEGRGIPFLKQLEFESALDLFRAMFRKYSASKTFDSIRFAKVMRLFSDFIDFDRVPTHLVWDVDELYRLLYECPNSREYQDKYLYFGSKAVLPPSIEMSGNNTVKKLLE